jgi:hypothetical protein
MSDRKRRRAASGVFITALLLLAPIVMTGSALGGTPEFSNVPTDITVEATSASGAVVTYTPPTAADSDTSTDVPVACDPVSGSTFPLEDTTVTCTADEGGGNSASASFKVTVQDTTPPEISGVPADITAEATSASGAVVDYTNPTATDLVDPSPTVTCAPASGSTFPLGATTVTCSATDSHGNSSSKSFKVTVQDTTGPAISGVPADKTVEATSSSGATVSYTNPTSTDLVDGAVPVNCTPLSGSTFPLGDTTVSCSATDSHGNSSSKTFKVTVQDTTGPVISNTPDSIIARATDSSGAVVNYTPPTATDAVDGLRPVTCLPNTGSKFPIGATTVTCSATDTSGNTSSTSFTVTVEDKNAPVLSSVPDITVEATGPSGAIVTYTAPTAVDMVDGPVPVTCYLPDSSVSVSPSTFPIGTTTVTCSATDSHGLTGSVTFKVTVQDKTPPAITGTPAQISATAPSSSGIAVTYTAPTASDLVDGTVSVSCAPGSGSTFPVGTTTVTCSAQDSRGNKRAVTFKVVVSPPAPVATPSLIVPLSLKAEATSRAGAVVHFVVSSSDNPAPTIVCNHSPGSLFPFGNTKVTCTATGASGGGKAVQSFTVSVRDTTAPVFAGKPSNIVEKVSGKKPLKVVYKRPAATDAVDGKVTSVCSPRSGSKFKLGKTTVTCKATDAHKNSSEISFSVKVSALPSRALIAPLSGASLSSPPLLKWTAIAKADYYNVQVFRNGHKVLSTWPRASSFRLKRGWKFEGVKRQLAPGTYTWYVWPGFGSLAAASYGRLIGKGTFKIVR